MKIMLDAGHGYSTAGKRSPDGIREYEFTRMVAAYAKDILETYQNVTVYLAHSDARDVPLQERTDDANRLMVDAYVSIHGNAYGTTWNDANGIETYVYLTKPKEAYELALKIQQHLVVMTGLRDRGVKTADFHVLRETHMTAALSECGFYTNKDEAARMKTEAFQRTCAQAIVQGIADQYHLVKKSVPTPGGQAFFKVQVGAFSERKNADDLVASLKSKGFNSFIYSENSQFKVQAGAFAERKNAKDLAARLKANGFNAYIHLD
ncbi:N-acetylmuramoyl-L-alanine amidase [Neobacillus massiliamazoniensis]|uniref:N-acetylmuramoyl-L-alanine amidase n=1 Tax=Neobacillus massiliamazoniensis TaxID=1499688 RepID=A0A0U1NTT2_9BACI|nr:N-acetylmuramoyl-L-alanine amidase [Neobacillus massiliamazoniensis]CRK81450.1 N-acetylmuramoyl-L-alanine amidase [Neobacillus massiliamazoniensis]